MQEMADPALSLDQARQTWQQHGRGLKLQKAMQTRAKTPTRSIKAAIKPMPE
jgi:hypothetical protein